MGRAVATALQQIVQHTLATAQRLASNATPGAAPSGFEFATTDACSCSSIARLSQCSTAPANCNQCQPTCQPPQLRRETAAAAAQAPGCETAAYARQYASCKLLTCKLLSSPHTSNHSLDLMPGRGCAASGAASTAAAAAAAHCLPLSQAHAACCWRLFPIPQHVSS